MVRRVIPALEAGRKVYTNIAGIDHAKLAELLGKPVADVEALLVVLTDAQLVDLPSLDLENCLLVVDEVQNFWGTRDRLGPTMVKWVAEHGHHGIDVILMSQDIRDVHVIWRRRVEIRQVTLKLTGVGRPNSYSVTTYRGKGSELYEKVGTKVVKYDPKYFGIYASYSGGDVSTDVYSDERSTVWGSAVFAKVLPVVFLAGAVGAWYMWRYFQAPDSPTAPAVVAPAVAPVARPLASGGSVVSSDRLERARAAARAAELRARPAVDWFADLASDHRMRLTGSGSFKGVDYGVVEWLADGGRVVERLTFDQLRGLGAALRVGDGFIVVTYGKAQYFATQWPVEEPLGRSSDAVVQQVHQSGPVAAAPAPVSASVSRDVTASALRVSADHQGRSDGETLRWMRERSLKRAAADS